MDRGPLIEEQGPSSSGNTGMPCKSKWGLQPADEISTDAQKKNANKRGRPPKSSSMKKNVISTHPSLFHVEGFPTGFFHLSRPFLLIILSGLCFYVMSGFVHLRLNTNGFFVAFSFLVRWVVVVFVSRFMFLLFHPHTTLVRYP